MKIVFDGTLDAIVEEMRDFVYVASAGINEPAAELDTLLREKLKAKPQKKKAAPVDKPEAPATNSRRRTSTPAAEPAPKGGLSDADVAKVSSLAAAEIGAPRVKELMKEFAVTNVAQLNAEQRVEFVALLKVEQDDA